MEEVKPRRRFRVGDQFVDQLDAHLFWASAHAARYAIANYSSEDEDAVLMSALRCGMAVEYQLLSTLAAESPALLAGPNGRQSLASRLVLNEAAQPLGLTAANLRTIDVDEAFEAVQLIHPQLALDRKRFDDLKGVRNAAAHMALVDAAPLEKAVGAMAAILEQLLNVRGSNRAQFWTEDLLPLVSVTVQTAESAALRRFQSRVVAASSKLADLRGRVSSDQVESLLAILEDRPSRIKRNGQQVERECPVCHRRGWVSYLVFEGKPQVTLSDDDIYVGFPRVGVPDYFDCPVCGLQLENAEMNIAGLNEEIELEDRVMQPGEYFEDEEAILAMD
ncbi:hypothetical protein [Diaminobutyricimonas sp. TR449]|uniref:hypothetical protein n=1 Tax=Diaminobutyricimonas sp. TR449 TaxID=2708076 RepID=UPI001421D4C9|nr:hypothetical protein [Diaminobutyricimonas sp. TR449]